MFFVISKILDVFISPTNWILFFLVMTLLAKNPLKRKRRLIIVFSLFFFFSHYVVLNEALNVWEPEESTPEEVEHHTYGVVLMGMIDFNRETGEGHFAGATDRLMQALVLLKMKKVDTLVLTGGSGSLYYQHMKEADFVKKWLEKMSIGNGRILVESQSQNTHQSAAILAERFQKFGGEEIVLITSAMHMPRSLACFAKEGVLAQGYVANPLAGMRDYSIKEFIFPSSSALGIWKSLIHEWVGMVAYKFRGYI